MVTREDMIGYISDALMDVFYYDRKDDKGFTVEDADRVLHEYNLYRFHELLVDAGDHFLKFGGGIKLKDE